jgi:hypothetical protein
MITCNNNTITREEELSMWNDFMNSIIKGEHKPLFEAKDNKPVLKKFGKNLQKERFVHGKKVETQIKTIVENAVEKKNKHTGVVYFMYTLENGIITPLYIGKSEFKGHTRSLSANVNSSPTGPFLRWGCRESYHMGDLYEAYISAEGSLKYKDWAEAIFNDKGELKQEVYLHVHSFEKMKTPFFYWDLSVAQAENTMITWAGRLFPDTLLNRDGKSRF